jgi:hypothetical protein
VATLPPILIIGGFKIYIDRNFDSAFRYFIPTPEELAAAKIHSERADARANKLEKRFGHPALHADLFTPMLHANMMGLLGQVYQGKIGRDHAKLDEYGGQKMEAQVVQGIKIAAIDQVQFCFIYFFDLMLIRSSRSARPRIRSEPLSQKLGR